MSDFRLKVIAETKAAERGLKQVAQVADKATRERKLNIDLRSLNKGLSSVTTDIKSATNNIKTFYKISKNVPGIGDKVEEFEKLAKSSAEAAKTGIALKENAKAGNILANSFQLAASKGNQLLTVLAKLGLATFAVKEAVNILQSAWNGFFNNTIGREIKLRETILKTQTTLASTNKVFADGKEITDPYQKIITLTGAVKKNIDSIRERSIALAGVTSNEVIEVFGIVASQVGQIGGGLKEAEDLAINFAAALGTFGIPLYQARQEVGSILRGDITMDSYLAKALGITNEDIAKAKTASGGVVKFLEERLAAAVAGQKIAAEGFSGVVSNIADLGELIGQNFGRGLLDPLLAGLSAVFESLFLIRKQLFGIASAAGKALGTAGRLVVGLTAGRTGIGAGDPSKAAAAAADVAQRGFTKLEEVAQRTVGALAQAIEALKPTALILVDAFKNIAEAFIRIKVGTFEALASVLANIASVVGALAPSLATVFNLYAGFLNTPIVQYFSEVAAVLGLLKRAGLDALTQLALFGRFIISSVIPAVGGLGSALGLLVAAVAAVVVSLGKLILVLAGLATALVGPATIIPAVGAALKALSVELFTVGKQAVASGTKINGVAASFRGLGASAKAAGLTILKSLGWIAVIQIGLSVLIDIFGRYRRAQENQRSNERAAEALRRLQTTYKDVGDAADSATKSARDFEQAIVNANYSRNIEELEKVREKIKRVKEELKPGIQTSGELLSALSGAELGSFEERARASLARLKSEEAAIKEWLSGVDAARDKEQRDRDIKLRSQQRSNLEKEIAQLRRQIDTDLFQQRQTLARKEVEIFRAAGELRIKEIEKGNAKLIEGEEGLSKAILEGVNQYIATRERGELDIEASRRQLTIEITNLDKLASDYRYSIEQKIAELRKKSADYEKQTAEEREAAAKGETSSVATAGEPSLPDPEAIAIAYEAAVAKIKSATAQLQKLSADATRAQIQASLEQIAKTVPKIELEQYTDRLSELKLNMDAIASSASRTLDPQSIAIGSQGIQQGLIVRREISQAAAEFNKFTKLNATEQTQILDYLTQRYHEYLNGIAEEVKYKKEVLAAERALEFITTSATSVEAINNEIEALKLRNSLRAEGVAPALIQAELQKLEIQRQMNRLLEQATPEQQAGIRAAAARQAAAVDARAQALTAPGSDIANFIGDAQRELEDLEALAIRVSQSIGNAVGNALTDGIAGLVEGTKTAQEVFSDFLKDIGQILLREAAKMIATYVAIGVARLFAGLGSGGGGGEAINTESLNQISNYSGVNANTDISGIVSGFRANGGPVNANQPYIIGERGPEMFVPFQSGQVLSNNETEAMMSSAFQHNGSVSLPFTRSSERITSERHERETLAAIRDPGPINVRYESQVINGVEYVTAEQHRKGMAQAAERGRALTLQALQNSPRTRAKVGI